MKWVVPVYICLTKAKLFWYGLNSLLFLIYYLGINNIWRFNCVGGNFSFLLLFFLDYSLIVEFTLLTRVWLLCLTLMRLTLQRLMSCSLPSMYFFPSFFLKYLDNAALNLDILCFIALFYLCKISDHILSELVFYILLRLLPPY